MLVTCPDCKKQISSLVTACPNCGYPGPFAAAKEEEALPVVAQQVQDAQEQEKTPPSLVVKKTGIARKIGVIAVLALVIVGVVGVIWNDKIGYWIDGHITLPKQCNNNIYSACDGLAYFPHLSDEASFSLHMKACEGDPQYCDGVAFLYLRGRGIAKDLKKAEQFYTKACDAKSSVCKEAVSAFSYHESPLSAALLYKRMGSRGSILDFREILSKVGATEAQFNALVQAGVDIDTTEKFKAELARFKANQSPEQTVTNSIDIEGTPKTQTNSIGMEFVLIPTGSFMMGSDLYADSNETPQHRVTISQSFYLGKYEVTQAQWEAVMGNNPSEFKGQSNPVENVSWNDAQTFIERLNRKEGTKKYRLPTEAEWEYAARAGTTTLFSFGDDVDSLGQYAWYATIMSLPVGGKLPNPWGLYDMHGNVWEWVQDWYDESYYAKSPASDPRGPAVGSNRVLRGGGFASDSAEPLRSAKRGSYSPEIRSVVSGFRIAFSPNSP
jgi:formylglycine-generating enzyme required for sulfatase activity